LSADRLERDLSEEGIFYRWIPELGGRRRANTGSVNTGWRNASFQGYADHLSTEEFAEGLFELSMLANGLRTAVMCAEILWWRCHRRLIADVLTSLSVDVYHIQSTDPPALHRLIAPARLIDGELTYAPEGGQMELKLTVDSLR
jgi:uncharacterized protein (DUF488 family)